MGVWKLAWSITLLIIIVPQRCHGDCINNLNICEWYPWESWSSCSRTCGGGALTRTRSLCCKADLDFDACLRDCSLPNTGRETQSCNTDCQHGGTYSNGYCHCPPLRYGICCERDEAHAVGDCAKRCTWTNWRSWSSCSTTCGGGTRTRTRNSCCLQGLTTDQCMSNCTFSSSDQRETSACSGYCSNGGTVSITYCGCPPGYGGACCEIERTPGDCSKCSLLAWSNWGSCSETCGGGEQSRTRKPCCRLQQSQQECMAECGLSGEDLQMANNCSQTCDHGVFNNSQCHCYDGYRGRCCNIERTPGDCSKCSLLAWSNWGSCSETCGGGEQSRTRKPCCRLQQSQQECTAECGLSGEDLQMTQNCSQTCDHGVFNNSQCHCYDDYRGRCCNIERTPGDCSKCSLLAWSNWGSCSETCGGGEQSRTRKPCCRLQQSQQECMAECGLSGKDLQMTHNCSQTCDHGVFNNSQCHCYDGYRGRCCNIERTPGDCSKCSLLAWSNWGSCSETCGGGEQSRTRKPCCRLQQSQQECMAECGLSGKDLQMTHNCSQTCDHGVFNNSQCHCYDGYRGRCCNIERTPGDCSKCSLLAWSNWGSCSETCGGGEQSRTRQPCCRLQQSQQECMAECGLSGEDLQMTHNCSQTCDHGVFNNSQCHCYDDYRGRCCNIERTPGDCSKCSLLAWSNWGSCSETCGGGEQSRTRKPCCRLQQSQQECMAECGLSGKDLQMANNCSQTCDHGVFTNSQCHCYDGYRGRCCNIERTPGDCSKCSLLAWSNWGSCSETCGGGEQSRTRKPCCRLQQSQQECMAECGLSGKDLQMTHNCSQTCDHGVFTNSQCHCYDDYRGRCCNIGGITPSRFGEVPIHDVLYSICIKGREAVTRRLNFGLYGNAGSIS